MTILRSLLRSLLRMFFARPIVRAIERRRMDLMAELHRAQRRCDTRRVHRLQTELKRATTEALREEVA